MAGGRNQPDVVFVTHHLPWPICSGGRLREAELLSRLAPRFDVELIAISQVPDLDLAHVREAARHGVEAHVFPAEPPNVGCASLHVCRYQSNAARAYLDRRLAEVKNTVIHVEGHYLLNLLPPAAQRQALVVEHNVESTLFVQRARLSTDPVEQQRLLDDAGMTRHAERSAWRTARLVGAVTEDDARLIQEAVPGIHVAVIPDGADHLCGATIPALNETEGKGRLLFVANLAYQPNEDAARVLVMEIFPEVLNRCPDATLAIVGPSPPRWLQDVARCQPQINVTGWVTDIAAWLDAAEVVVCPLRVGDGIKVKILEALARGRAVVTTPIGLQGLRHLAPEPDAARLVDMRSDRRALRERFALPVDRFLVGTVGRLSSEKRIDLMLRAAQYVVADRRRMHVVVIGGGGQRVALETLAARLGIRGSITFTGLLKDLTPVYAALDLLIQPSDTEGTPRTILEAMAHYVPVIATDVGDVGELLGYGSAGVLIPPNDADALARAIIWVLDHPLRMRELAERAHARYKQHYTIDDMRRQVGEIYALAVRAAGTRRRR